MLPGLAADRVFICWPAHNLALTCSIDSQPNCCWVLVSSQIAKTNPHVHCSMPPGSLPTCFWGLALKASSSPQGRLVVAQDGVIQASTQH